MNRLLPVNWLMKVPGDGWPRSESAARYTPAGQPSVRAARPAASEPASWIPAMLSTSEATSAAVKRSSGARISAMSPAARSRPSGSGGPARVTSTTWTGRGMCDSRNSVCWLQSRSLIIW